MKYFYNCNVLFLIQSNELDEDITSGTSKPDGIDNEKRPNSEQKINDANESDCDSAEMLPDLSFESNDDDVEVIVAPSEAIKSIDVQSMNEISNENMKRNKFSWVKERVTKDLDEAVDMITNDGFKLYDDHDLKIGQKFYFRCGKIAQSRKTWCSKRYIIFLPANNDDVEVLCNGLEHNHNELLKGVYLFVANFS